jgi:hypothetical protein
MGHRALTESYRPLVNEEDAPLEPAIPKSGDLEHITFSWVPTLSSGVEYLPPPSNWSNEGCFFSTAKATR